MSEMKLSGYDLYIYVQMRVLKNTTTAENEVIKRIMSEWTTMGKDARKVWSELASSLDHQTAFYDEASSLCTF